MSEHIKDTLYDYVKNQESVYQRPIFLEDGWSWSMKNHLRRSYLYKNSQFEERNGDRDKRPFKNIVRAILNIHYRTEGFDVKDIEIYVNSPDIYWKSFLIKKFHDQWALDNELDTWIDEVVESYVDYGGVLVKNVKGARPEVVSLRSLAFCDQTDLLSGPFAIKHYFSPQQLREMADKGWGQASNNATIGLETLIFLSEHNKAKDKQNNPNETPGKYIEVYEVHGTFPNKMLSGDEEDDKDDKYTNQIHIVAYYKDSNDKERGVTLFASKEPKLPFKYLSRDNVDGRALGFGGVEELFEAQTWTNQAEIEIMEMLGLASKILFKTNDPSFKTRNQINDTDNGEILTLQEGRDINQLDTTPRNLAVFNDAMDRWQAHAQQLGAAGEPLLGESPSSGTPFKLFEAQLIEGKSLHQWRQGKIASFVDEVYRDWILPMIAREITKDNEFLSELSGEEFIKLTEDVADNRAKRERIEQVLNGELPEDLEILRQKKRDDFSRKGNKRFLRILKDEFKGKPLKVMTNIKGKQKDLALMTDKLVNLVRQFIATPQLRQDPELVKMLNRILEGSGISPMMLSSAPPPQAQQAQQGTGDTGGLQQLGKTVQEAAAPRQ